MERRHAAFGRREFLLASGTLALVGTIGNTTAQGKAFSEGAAIITKCPPAGNPCVKYLESSNDEFFTDLAAAARKCVTTAKASVDYFTGDLGMGVQDSGKCLKLAEAVVAGCEAVALLASSESPYLDRFAVPATEICEVCEAHCITLKDHKPCVDFAKACRTFVDQWHQVTVILQVDL